MTTKCRLAWVNTSTDETGTHSLDYTGNEDVAEYIANTMNEMMAEFGITIVFFAEMREEEN